MKTPATSAGVLDPTPYSLTPLTLVRHLPDYEYVDATNRPSEVSLSYLEGKYPDQVNYYGNLLPKAPVLEDKKAFFKKWPIRTYPLDRLDFCASALATRPVHRAPSFVLFLVLGFSILARSCEAMILAFKGAEYATD